MEIRGKAHCFFEQSGTFKNEFIKLGIPAEDYDIQNNFGETDNVIDLFAEIENCYRGGQSIFDNITPDDIIVAFFPCIYFCESSQAAFNYWAYNYRKLRIREKTDKILERSKNREFFYQLLIKMFCIVQERGLRMIVENPYSPIGYLHLSENFVCKPTIIDKDRTLRGDYFKKPTAYWFVNCKNTYNFSFQKDKKQKTIRNCKSSSEAGLCSEDRSMISPDYARNFICDFILGKEQENTQLTLF